MRVSLVTALALSGAALGTTACEKNTPTSPTDDAASAFSITAAAPAASPANRSTSGPQASSALSADAQAQIAQLRRLLAPFHNFDKAVEYGYSVPVPAPGICLSDPIRGGMGYHYAYAHADQVRDGEVNLFEPEFIVYSPTRNGGVRLSAVDYFVPYDTWPAGAPPPSLLGVPFAREDALNAYVLHIWAFWPNPSGIFENYNPDVPPCPE